MVGMNVTCVPPTFSFEDELHPKNRTLLQKFLHPGFYLKRWKNISLSSFDDSWNLRAYISVEKKAMWACHYEAGWRRGSSPYL